MSASDWPRLQKQWVTVAILVLGALSCLSLAVLQWNIIRVQRDIEVNEAVQIRLDALEKEIKRAEDLQDALVAFFETAGSVDRRQFEAFAARLPAVNFQAISFAAYVPAGKRDEFERRLRADRAGASQIWELNSVEQPQPSSERDAYFPVTYVYPVSGNSTALGFDLLSEPRRKRAILAAVETGKSVRTEPIRLVQDRDHWAFLVFRPVYVQPDPLSPGNAFGRQLVGVVSSVYQYRSLLSAGVDRAGIAKHDIALFDSTQPSSPVHVHHAQVSNQGRPVLEQSLSMTASAAGAHSVSVSAMQRDLVAVFLASDAGAAWWRQISTAILATLALGLCLTAALVWNHVRAQRLAVRLEEATDELRVKKEVAEKENISKTRFLAAASHDLRQPLHALSLFSAALSQKDAAPDVREIASNIGRSVRSLSGLVDALLDISKLDAGVIEPDMRPVDVSALVSRIATEYRDAAERKGSSIEVKPCDSSAFTDPVLLERILRNLIDNAVKYTTGGRISVNLEVEQADLRIAISDTGEGIPVSERERIFEEFYQIGNPERDRIKGLGLGLAIVRRIGRLLGTEVELVSEVGRGSTFTIRLPVAREPGLATQEVVAMPAFRGLLQGCSVLLIDDETDVLDAMQGLLTLWGCKVAVCAGIDEAESLLDEHDLKLDLIIADLRLRGGENGIETIMRLRKSLGPVPGLLISGDMDPERLKEAAGSGLLLLHKPVTPDGLHSAMVRCMQP